MSIKLDNEITQLLESNNTVKALATIGGHGEPYVIISDLIYPYEDGKIIFLELLESSNTNNNLVRSIWFDKEISLGIKAGNGRSHQIRGRIVKSVIAGKVFQKYYKSVREKLGDVDLSAVWVIEPQEISNETFEDRKKYEETYHPFFKHLDRIAKKQ
ncbi:hypothetical protein LQZ19_01565 [Treponema primitia]|uniref:hypothetical protein n=1 Tax=Treponema primitia TaxID=88058 RepID=UPI00398148E4